MKKNIFTKKVTTAILAGALALSFAGCSELDPEVDANAQAAGNAAAGEFPEVQLVRHLLR